MEKEKTYTLRISENELKNARVQKLLLELIKLRIKIQKHKPFLMVSKAEYEFLRHHYTWTFVENYLPKKKDRLKGEVGKYNGKRVCIRGMK